MNDQVQPDQFDGPRPVRSEERDALLAMINLVFRTSRGWEPTIASDWGHVYTPANLANVMVVCDQGKLVASTGVWPSEVRLGSVRLRVGGINCVGTREEYRRHGLGSATMVAAQQRMRDLGCHVGLLGTGISSWYRRLGWEQAVSVRAYFINRSNVGLLPQLSDGISTRFVELGPEDLGPHASGVQANQDQNQDQEEIAKAVVRLYNQAHLGAVRTVEGFCQLLAARKNPRLLVAEAEGTPCAYLLLRDQTVVEWAGSIETVAGLVRSCFERVDDPQASTSQRTETSSPVALRHLALLTPGWRHPLVTWLDASGIPYQIDYLGMIYVVDPQAILDAYGLTEIEVKTEGDMFVLHYQGEQMTLNRSRLAKFFFGPERISNFAAEFFPLPFWQWYLEKV